MLCSGTRVALVEIPSMCADLVGIPAINPASRSAERCGIPEPTRAAGYASGSEP